MGRAAGSYAVPWDCRISTARRGTTRCDAVPRFTTHFPIKYTNWAINDTQRHTLPSPIHGKLSPRQPSLPSKVPSPSICRLQGLGRPNCSEPPCPCANYVQRLDDPCNSFTGMVSDKNVNGRTIRSEKESSMRIRTSGVLIRNNTVR